MPKLAKRLTDTLARTLAPPPALKSQTPRKPAAAGTAEAAKKKHGRLPTNYALYWCRDTPGFGVRITSGGARAWVSERRVDGKTKRRTLGLVDGARAISADAARRLQLDISSELQQGTDRLEAKRERVKVEKTEAVTLEAALRQYVKTKRRGKDGLPLKARTQADYLAMLARAGATASGRPTHAGELHALADKSLVKITSGDIRGVYASLEKRGERRQTYAMQVLRAVLRHYGVQVADNPLSPTTAGAARVQLAPGRANPSPIPPERLGAWWMAAKALDTPSADMLRFQLLTGCRPGEAAGIAVRDVDLEGGRILLQDTKNRLDHTLVLSKQALVLAQKHSEGKRPSALLFGVVSAPKTLAFINAVAGVKDVSPHKLRHTFATVAAELVPYYTVKKMLNHIGAADVTGAHYVGASETQLRKAWQTVADFIEAAGKKKKAQAVVA